MFIFPEFLMTASSSSCSEGYLFLFVWFSQLKVQLYSFVWYSKFQYVLNFSKAYWLYYCIPVKDKNGVTQVVVVHVLHIAWCMNQRELSDHEWPSRSYQSTSKTWSLSWHRNYHTMVHHIMATHACPCMQPYCWAHDTMKSQCAWLSKDAPMQ